MAFDWQEVAQEGAEEKINLMINSNNLPDIFFGTGGVKIGTNSLKLEKDGRLHLFHLVIPNRDTVGHIVSDDGMSWQVLPDAIHTGASGEPELSANSRLLMSLFSFTRLKGDIGLFAECGSFSTKKLSIKQMCVTQHSISC